MNNTHDYLARLLLIIPCVVQHDGISLDALATTLGIDQQQIIADLNLLSMVGRPPLTPDHLIDVYIEDNIVYVDLDQRLSRPLRLTHQEALALILGAKLLSNTSDLGDALQAVLNRLLQHLHALDKVILKRFDTHIAVRPGHMQLNFRAATHMQEIMQSMFAPIQHATNNTSSTPTLVKFSAATLPHILEHFGHGLIKTLDNGDMIVALHTSSPAWLAHWLLPFATYAEVLAPSGCRNYLENFCQEALLVYNKDLAT